MRKETSMPETVVELTESQRRSLGGVFARIERILLEAQASGFQPAALPELERAVEQMKHETAAIVPPKRDDLPALLAELYVLIGEIKPRGLRPYGDLSEEATAYIEGATGRLEQMAGELIDHANKQSRKGRPDAV
jgi:hypothetical protein